MVVLLCRFAGMSFQEAMNLDWEEAGAWVDTALEIEKEINTPFKG